MSVLFDQKAGVSIWLWPALSAAAAVRLFDPARIAQLCGIESPFLEEQCLAKPRTLTTND